MEELIVQITIGVFIGMIGLCIGSFLNVVIYRLPNKMSLNKPASHCPKCDKAIAWYDNIPLVSYLILGGKCRHCHSKISIQYPLVELLTALLFVGSYLKFGLTFDCLIACLVITLFIGLSGIDYKHMFIPDSIIIGLLVVAVFGFIVNAPRVTNWSEKLLTFVLGIVITIFVILLSRLLRRDIIGYGDLKLFVATGLIIGYKLALIGIFFGAVCAMIIELLLKGKRKGVIPFGPYLAMGFMISFFLGNEIINWYISFFAF